MKALSHRLTSLVLDAAASPAPPVDSSCRLMALRVVDAAGARAASRRDDVSRDRVLQTSNIRQYNVHAS